MGVFSQCAKRGPPPSYEFYPETPFLVFALFTTSNTVMEATGTKTITVLVFVPKEQNQKIVIRLLKKRNENEKDLEEKLSFSRAQSEKYQRKLLFTHEEKLKD